MKGGVATEILGFFIILGTLVVVVLNRQLWQKRESGAPTEELEEASRRLRREMEKSADEILSRMSAKIDRLERLVTEADERSQRLERQLAEQREAAKIREEAPRPQRGFEEILSDSLAEEELPDERPPRREASPTGVRRRSAAWAEQASVPVDSLARKTPPVALAPSLEVVVAPSVADVVDLPMMAPEVEELTWTAADDLAETAEPSAYTEEAVVSYDAYPTASRPAEVVPAPPMAAASEYAPPVAGYETPAAAPASSAPVLPEIAPTAASVPEGYAAAQAMTGYAPEVSGESVSYGSLADAGAVVPENSPLARMTGAEADGSFADYASEMPDATAEETPLLSETPDEEAANDVAGEWETPEDREAAEEAQQVDEALQGSRLAASNRARELLEQGRSVEEVAREIHMGRSAVELMAQIVRRKSEPPH